MTDSYAELLTRTREIHLLESTSEILSWDQETMMPPGGVEHRARQLALLARLAHERATDPKFGESLEASGDDADPDVPRAVNVRELRRDFERRTRLPASLVEELAETSSLGQHAWAVARSASDFAAFRPWLEKLVGLARAKAECLGVPDGGELWDALAEDYERGMRAADLADGTWRDDYYGVQPPDLSMTPQPRWDLYSHHRALCGSIQTSRGCPFSCEFCDAIQFLGRKQRWKTPAQAISELDELYRLGFRRMYVADDNFTANRSTLLPSFMPKTGAVDLIISVLNLSARWP